MTPGATALALLDSTVAARARPADALRILKGVAADAIGFEGPRGEAREVVAELFEAAEASA